MGLGPYHTSPCMWEESDGRVACLLKPLEHVHVSKHPVVIPGTDT